MKPKWCEKLADEAAEAYHKWLYGTRLKHSTPELSRFIARALLAAKREQQAEIDRLNKVIERMQSTMSSQAEQWTRSMAEAKREGMMDAATFLRDHATISNGETLDPAIPEILKAFYQKAGDHRPGDDELIGTARQ